ncbi:MAG: PIN domain-containing protein [Chloroflexi bacterium]|nr:PIN domain-containing protein [Chloroflexota bacterium]
MRLMLDASFLIDHLRDDPGAVARFAAIFEDGDEPLVNMIGVCEVATGLRPAEARRFASLLAAVEFVQAGPEAAQDAGRWRREARQSGNALSIGDSIIAAEAHHSGATVLTRNLRDFALTPVRVLTY